MAALVRGLRRLAVMPSLRATVVASYSANPTEGTIPTDYDQATGIEKKEIDARVAGHEDPFSMKVHSIPWGTKIQPTIVPSMCNERLVGCICQEEATNVEWLQLKSGPPQRCECGHWFQLIQGNPTKIQY
ncbi:cytochrome c oxidase subunit 5B, mitochondrial-like [Halichondria panicea]|uniref:cytochrome c oxidase subunit 5B, mitochondrial-like n=1 Tax=Halichondria panicea TaxID=6063 RepID=UPI00312B549A